MKTKTLLFSLFSLTLFAIAATLSLLLNSTPSSKDLISAFYATFFLATAGITFFCLFGLSYAHHRLTPPWQDTVKCFRYATLVAAFLTLSLILNSHSLLSTPMFVFLLMLAIAGDLVWRRKSAIKIKS